MVERRTYENNIDRVTDGDVLGMMFWGVMFWKKRLPKHRTLWLMIKE